METEKCRISLLCSTDADKIAKVRTTFKNIVRRILEEKPELIGRIRAGYIGGEGKFRPLKYHGEIIPVCRLIWNIVGEKDAMDAFFDEWNRIDKVSFCYFRIERDYSLSQIAYQMNIRKGEET